jgi:quinol monooxygenase YgiN
MAGQPDGRGSLLSVVMIVLLIATLVMAVAAMVI